jgi:hypothetical protein
MTADELRAAGLAPQTSTNVAFDHYGEQVEFDLEIINVRAIHLMQPEHHLTHNPSSSSAGLSILCEGCPR